MSDKDKDKWQGVSKSVGKKDVAQSGEQPGQWVKSILVAGAAQSIDAKGPIISAAGSKDKYLGRVVIEFYEIDGAQSDADGIAYSVEALDGNHARLSNRVAAAFAARIAKAPLR